MFNNNTTVSDTLTHHGGPPNMQNYLPQLLKLITC